MSAHIHKHTPQQKLQLKAAAAALSYLSSFIWQEMVPLPRVGKPAQLNEGNQGNSPNWHTQAISQLIPDQLILTI